MKKDHPNSVSVREESQRLRRIAGDFTQFDKDIKVNRFRAQTIASLCKGTTVLELGCADGLVTEVIAQKFDKVVAVDGASEMIDRLRARVPQADFVCSLFEEYRPDIRFDSVVLGHILEHVVDPVSLLRRVKGWLTADGIIIITVPNGESVHRRLGLEMGLIQDVTELSEDDHRIGHRRIYTSTSLGEEVAAAGLKIEHSEGIMFKPLSNTQMFDWQDDLLSACYRLGKKMPPDLGGELCVVCR